MSFVSVDALERELRKLEGRQQVSRREIPDYPVEFAMGVGIEPDPWQVEVLASEHPRKILCCACYPQGAHPARVYGARGCAR